MRGEKKLISLSVVAVLILIFLSTAAFAVPQTINYQGYVESGGVPVNDTVSMSFAIYNASSGGTAFWTETQPSVTVTGGAFSVVLGINNAIDLPFDEKYYLGVDVNGDGEMAPRAELVSVPYAMRAKEVDTAPAHVHSGSDITSGMVSATFLNTTVEVQRRVAEGCAPGYSIRVVNTNGSVTCEPDDNTTYTPGTGIDIVGTQINNIGDTNPSDDLTTGTTFSGDITGTYNALNIASGAVTSAEIADGAITGTDIAAGSIPGAKLSVPLSLSGSSASPIVSSTNTGTGRAGTFQINNSGNSQTALYAETNGSGSAVHAQTSGIGSAVYGYTSGSGQAVYGYTTGSGQAVSGYAGGNTGKAGYFRIMNGSNGDTALNVQTYGSGYSGIFDGGAGVWIIGNLHVTNGTKNFLQPHPTDPTKQIAYVAIEAPESAVMLRGRAKLVDGRAVIETPEYFRVVAGSDEDIVVQFTPRTLNTLGLAAVEVTKDKIVVGELMNGTGSFEFDYFITAKRAGYEGHEPIQPNTAFTADMKTAEEFERMYAKEGPVRDLLVSNGILTADGKLNMELAKELGWVVKDSDVAMHEGE